jgi:hypothetical protein
MNLGEIDARPELLRLAGRARRKQQLIETPVVAIFRQRPTQASGGGALQISMNGRLAD